jgi:hypothetical protein
MRSPVLVSCTTWPSTQTVTASASASATACGRHHLRADRAEAVARLVAHRGPVEAVVRHAEVGHDTSRPHAVQRIAGASRQAVRPITMPSAAPTSSAGTPAGTATTAPSPTCVLRGLMYSTGRPRRRLVGRRVHRLAQRGQRRPVVQQHAEHLAGQAPGCKVEGQRCHDGRFTHIEAM